MFSINCTFQGQGCLSSRLGVQITNFALTLGVQAETPIFVAFKISFRVACKEIKNALILIWQFESLRIGII